MSNVLTLHEYYSDNDDSASNFRDTSWQCQTFTTTSAYVISSVKLKIYRVGSPGTITVSIRATDVGGKPTGADLASGTTDGDTLTTSSSGEWREITFGTPYSLSGTTKYAIVASTASGDYENEVLWKRDATSPTYSGGSAGDSTDSGSSWSLITTQDMMFECWESSALEPTVMSLAGTIPAPIIIEGQGVTVSADEVSSAFTLNAPTIIEGQGLTFSVDEVEGVFSVPTLFIDAVFWSNMTKHTNTYTNETKHTTTSDNMTKHSNTWDYQDKRI